MRPVLFALVLVLVAGCTAARPDAATGAAVSGSEPVVVLERTVCYGTCPAYTVSAFADGRVAFEGRQFVATTGAAEWRVAPSVVAGLVARAGAVGHARFPEHLSGPDVCEAEMTDGPSAITTVRTAAGGRHAVVHYSGCVGFAGKAALTAFEDAIDAALGTAARIGDGSNPTAPR